MSDQQKVQPWGVKWGTLPDDVDIETDDTVEEVDPADPGELAAWLRIQTGEVDD